MSTQDTDDLVQQAIDGSETALAALLSQYRPRLRRMVSLRMDPRVKSRVDASDVLQEAFIDLANRLPEYGKNPKYPFFLWMRLVTGQQLWRVHRRHLGAAKRNAERDVSLHQNRIPEASTLFLASILAGQFTSADANVIRAELQTKLQDVLNGMDANDREILAMKHFEELSNVEIATVLGISVAATSKRYVRALHRLRIAVESVPGLAE